MTWGAKIGLGNDFCANVVAAVGNYGESYNRNVGPDTPLKLERGVNALWSAWRAAVRGSSALGLFT